MIAVDALGEGDEILIVLRDGGSIAGVLRERLAPEILAVVAWGSSTVRLVRVLDVARVEDARSLSPGRRFELAVEQHENEGGLP
jgi:hypothetical protein